MSDTREFTEKRMLYNLDDCIESFDDLRLLSINNIILVEKISNTDKYADSEISVVKGWNKALHAERWFRVVKLPDKVFFNPRYESCNTYQTEMELQEGDEVVINLSESLNSWIYSFKGKTYYTIKYDSVVCAVRKENIIPINGYILLKPIMEEHKALEYSVHKNSPDEATVAYIGSPNKDYKRNFAGRSTRRKPGKKWSDAGYSPLKVSDRIKLDNKLSFTGTEQGAMTWALEPDEHRVLPEQYFVTQRPRIHCTIEDLEN